jgi:hypothetical protein
MLDGDPVAYEHGRAVTTPEQGRALVAEMQAHRFDYLKIYNGLAQDVFRAIAEEARDRGMPIAGEVPDVVSPAEAAEAGMRSFEHLWNLFEFCVPGAYALRDSLGQMNRDQANEADVRQARDARYRRWLEGYDAECADSLAVHRMATERSQTGQGPAV